MIIVGSKCIARKQLLNAGDKIDGATGPIVSAERTPWPRRHIYRRLNVVFAILADIHGFAPGFSGYSTLRASASHKKTSTQ